MDEPLGQGKVIITERLTYDIHAASKDNLFWELWRDLPESYIDGQKVYYKVNSVKQILENGKKVIYKESPKLYWNDSDYLKTSKLYGPGKWYHSKGPYDEDRRQYECVLFYVDGLYREKVTFEIEYEMYNASFRYKDCSELYLATYSGDTIKYLKSYKGQILFPNNLMPSKGNYYAHTYGTNSNNFPFTVSTTKNPGYHTFSFELDESDLQFKPYNQYIEFALVSYGDDKHKFTKYASINDYYYDNVLDELKYEHIKYEITPKQFALYKFILLALCTAGSIYIIYYTLNKKKKLKNKYTFYEPTMKMDYFRDIPSNLDPIFANELVFCKDKKNKDVGDAYSAIILSLVRKKYIDLVKIKNELDWTFNNVKIIVKYKPTQPSQLSQDSSLNTEETKTLEPLTPTEQLYFNLIVRYAHLGETTMLNLQNRVSIDYQNTNTFVNNIEKSVTNIGIYERYFQQADYTEPRKKLKSKSTTFIVFAILIMIIGNLIISRTRFDLAFGAFFILGITLIISGLYLRKISKKYVLLTQFGEDEYVKWRGLYEFLNSETLMNERTVIELPIWEQYLVYATAFGISDKVVKALKIRCPEVNISPVLSNPYFRTTSFYHSSRTFRSATRTASYTASNGGHGGYGGGGRGGGGGRRRSLILINI